MAAAVAGALELVFDFVRSARLHSGLAGEFTKLEQDLVRAGEELAPPQLRDLEKRRLDVESREPPVLRVLAAMCHDELVTALDIEKACAGRILIRAPRRDSDRGRRAAYACHWAGAPAIRVSPGREGAPVRGGWHAGPDP